MTIWIIERNLLWSTRLKNMATALGHQATVHAAPPSEGLPDVALLNLAQDPDAETVCRELTARGVKVIGHAGHKEEDKLEIGRRAGCARVATNSELVNKLARLLGELEAAPEQIGPS